MGAHSQLFNGLPVHQLHICDFVALNYQSPCNIYLCLFVDIGSDNLRINFCTIFAVKLELLQRNSSPPKALHDKPCTFLLPAAWRPFVRPSKPLRQLFASSKRNNSTKSLTLNADQFQARLNTFEQSKWQRDLYICKPVLGCYNTKCIS